VITLAIQANFKRKLAEIINKFQQAERASIPPFPGGVPATAHEAATRVNFLDELIEALGWTLRLNLDMVQEARIKSDTTNFIDYLGLNTDRKPTLIVEAKSWGKSFIAAGQESTHGITDELALLRLAVNYVRSRSTGTRPVLKEWCDWITQVHKYVDDLRKEGHNVKRLVITSGQWMLVFIDPVNTLCHGQELSSANVLMFKLDRYIEQSDEILALLAKVVLTKQHPIYYRPTQLGSNISANTLAGAFLSVILRKVGQGISAHEPLPIIYIYPTILLVRDDGEMLNVAANTPPMHFEMPHSYSDIPNHFARLQAASDALVLQVNVALNTSLSLLPVTLFPGFVTSTASASMIGGGFPTLQKRYVRPTPGIPDEFLVVTGQNIHYLAQADLNNLCKYHTWSTCQGDQAEKGENAIVSRRVEKPASFFISSEAYHCAQRTVHDLRNNKCQIAGFEEFACCRRCTFEPVCWSPAELGQLPCTL